MALLGLPTEIVGGACAGLSASFFTTFELESDSTLAKWLFATKLRAVITSSSGALLIGFFVNPLAGLAFEGFFYPACWLKQKRVQKALEELDKILKDGEEGEVLIDNTWHTVKKRVSSEFSTNNNKEHDNEYDYRVFNS